MSKNKSDSWPGQNLRFLLLNAENLFLLFDQEPGPEVLKLDEVQWQRLSSSVFPNKPLRKLFELQRIIHEIQPDVIGLCEVGGQESLKNFTRLFLNSEYSSALIEGNSNRNIDVGFLVKKNLNFYFDIGTNKNRLLNFLYPHERILEKKPPSHKFSRDVAELRFFRKSQDKPFFMFLLCHLKSRLDYEGVDLNGFERRRAELLCLLEIYSENKKRFPQTPILVGGDFNGHAGLVQTDEEFRELYSRTDLRDVLEIAQVPLPQRFTYFSIKPGLRSEGKQIDYAFLSDLAQKHLQKDSSFVYRYKYPSGLEIDPPESLDAKLTLPSDHYPLVFTLENLKLE